MTQTMVLLQRGRLTLASVRLCFVFLLGLLPQPAAKMCYKDTVKRVHNLIARVSNLV